MSLPFGMIFSIILIVIFIVIAFIAIKYFLDIGDCAKVGQFYGELQKKVDDAWRSQESSFEISISLPSGVQEICFSNLSEAKLASSPGVEYKELKRYSVYDANTFIYPPSKSCEMPYKLINHINVSEMTKTKNPYCISVKDKLKIKKDIYDKSVIIE